MSAEASSPAPAAAGSRGSPLVPLGELQAEWLRSEPEFRRAYREPVLLVPELTSSLVVRTRSETASDADLTPFSMRAFRVKKGEQALGTFHPGVTMGRLEGNDLALAHSTISRLHAYLVEDRKKRWCVFDAESRNGTFLNSRRLLPNLPRDPQEGAWIRDGDCLRLGMVELTFLGADAFITYLSELVRR